MACYSIEPRTRKYVKGYRFLSLATQYGKQLLDTASKEVIYRAAEVTSYFLGKKIADKIVKQKPVNENSRNVKEIIIPPEKGRRNSKRIKTSIKKMEHFKICKLLNDSTVSKFLTRKWIEVNDLSSRQYATNKTMIFKTSMLRSDLCTIVMHVLL